MAEYMFYFLLQIFYILLKNILVIKHCFNNNNMSSTLKISLYTMKYLKFYITDLLMIIRIILSILYITRN